MASYAQVAARNSEQTAEEASAPAPQTIVPNESIGSDAASYSTGVLSDETSSQSSGNPGGVHIIDRSELADLDTSDEQVISEPGPSITVDRPHIHDETKDTTSPSDEDSANGNIKDIKEKIKGHKKLSKKDEKAVVLGGVGTLNLLALGGIGYWGWRRYSGGENGWKVIGMAAGIWCGVTSLEWLSVRAFAAWKQKKDKSS